MSNPTQNSCAVLVMLAKIIYRRTFLQADYLKTGSTAGGGSTNSKLNPAAMKITELDQKIEHAQHSYDSCLAKKVSDAEKAPGKSRALDS